MGAGWSSLVDMSATEVSTSGADVVVVRYPGGQEVAFGKNPDGTYAPPPGRYASFTAVSGGGYKLVDKDGTVYLFTAPASGPGVWSVSSISDGAGRTETFTYSSPTAPAVVTTITSASGRALHLTWSTPAGASAPHVATIFTDPVTGTDQSTALTWQYTYSGDLLTKVCPPTSWTTDCTTYTYTDGSLASTTVLNAGPRSYWRLGEQSGATAASAVLGNEGTDNGTYTNVTLGQPGRQAASTATAAGFNGTSSRVDLPSKLPAAACCWDSPPPRSPVRARRPGTPRCSTSAPTASSPDSSRPWPRPDSWAACRGSTPDGASTSPAYPTPTAPRCSSTTAGAAQTSNGR